MTTHNFALYPRATLELQTIPYDANPVAVPIDQLVGETRLIEGFAQASLGGQLQAEPSKLTASIYDPRGAYNGSPRLRPGAWATYKWRAGGSAIPRFTGRLVSARRDKTGTWRCEWLSPLSLITGGAGPDIPYGSTRISGTEMGYRIAEAAGIHRSRVSGSGAAGTWWVQIPRGSAGLSVLRDLASTLVYQIGSGTIQLRTIAQRISATPKNRRYTDFLTPLAGEHIIAPAIPHLDAWGVLNAATVIFRIVHPEAPIEYAVPGTIDSAAAPASTDHSHTFAGSGSAGEAGTVSISGKTGSTQVRVDGLVVADTSRQTLTAIVPKIVSRDFPFSHVDPASAALHGRHELERPILLTRVLSTPPTVEWTPEVAGIQSALQGYARTMAERYRTPTPVYEIEHVDHRSGILQRRVGDKEYLRLQGAVSGVAHVERLDTTFLRDGVFRQTAWYTLA